jgi:hypothetical protein
MSRNIIFVSEILFTSLKHGKRMLLVKFFIILKWYVT